VFQQVVDDMREEYCDALKEGNKWHARWIALRGRFALLMSAVQVVVSKCLAPISKLVSEFQKLGL